MWLVGVWFGSSGLPTIVRIAKSGVRHRRPTKHQSHLASCILKPATLHGRLRQCARRRCGLEASAGIVQSAFSGTKLSDSQHTLEHNESAT